MPGNIGPALYYQLSIVVSHTCTAYRFAAICSIHISSLLRPDDKPDVHHIKNNGRTNPVSVTGKLRRCKLLPEYRIQNKEYRISN